MTDLYILPKTLKILILDENNLFNAKKVAYHRST